MGSMGDFHAETESGGSGPSPHALVTPEEAIARGLVREAPPPVRCAHCGRPLQPLGVIAFGRVAWVSHEPCACVGAARERAGEEERLREEEAAGRQRRIERAGIPTRFRRAKATEPACIAYAEALCKATETGLYIHGPVGTGKTHNASAVAISAADRGMSTVFTSAITIFSSIRETFGTGESSKRVLERYASCDMLVLDDLGKESSSRWSLMTLFAIVNARYEEMRPMVITSQYDLGRLGARMASTGEPETAAAIVSRIAATCVDVGLIGPDYRNRAYSEVTSEPTSSTASRNPRFELTGFR